ncbi:hypothetical protein O3P69_020509 [Scylla paramamosain]|uniref:Cuticle protein n=1 Tax=Scylla paramamosain TaxID=85552 RepID=A0AAW0TPH4_SCYPA
MKLKGHCYLAGSHHEAGNRALHCIKAYDGVIEAQDSWTTSQHEAHEGAIAKAGHFSYTAPDGTPVSLKFVANEHGFQPESDLLPVAPEFPHPIPQYVLDQIARAAEEDRNRSPEGRYTYA